MQENVILQTAIRNFNQLTGFEMQETRSSRPLTGRVKPDAIIQIAAQGKRYSFRAEVKNELGNMYLAQLVQPPDWLLICQYISKTNRAILKRKEINYLDASGNCHIRRNTLVIFIDNQEVTRQREPKKGKLWKSSGLRLIFAILLQPLLLNEPYRNIAKKSNIGLGTIGGLLEELVQEGYCKRYDNYSLHLENRDALLNRWIEVFHATLRPKLVQGTFYFVNPDDVKDNWKTRPVNGILWGGEPAGALLTNYLRPEDFTIYSDLPKTEVMKQLRIAPRADGNVELLKPFWNTELIQGENSHTVPALLAYAELKASLDSRNNETAEKIKEQYHV